MKIAVITGLVIPPKNNSDEKIDDIILGQLVAYKNKELFDNSKNYTFFKSGTEFQIALQKSETAFEVALKIFLAVTSKIDGCKIKLSIGYGKFDEESKKIGKAKGEAFDFSVTGLEKTNKTSLFFQSKNEQLNNEMNMMFVLLEPLIKKLSVNMSEAMLMNLLGLPQTEIAWHLNLTQSAISKRLKSANSEVILEFLAYYKNRFQ